VIRVYTIAVVVLIVLQAATSVAAAQTPAAALGTAEEQLATALIADDTATFERLLAPEFVLRGAPDVNRATWIKNAVDMCWGDSFELSGLAVRNQTGDTAIVSLVMTTFQDPVTCEPAIIRSLLTDVWQRSPDGWRLVLRHSGPAGGSVGQQFAQLAPPPPLWEREAELSLVATGGNTETRTLGAGGGVTWRPAAWVTRARVAYVRSTNAGVVTTESLNADLRQSRALTKRVDIRAGAVYLSDRFAGIDDRITVDGGFGWLVVDQPPHTVKLDFGAGVTHERRIDAADLTYPVGTLDGQYRWRLSRLSALTEEVIFSADLQNAPNWRMRNLIDLTVAVNRRLSVKLAHELRRNNRPVRGFQTTDTVLSVALATRF